MEESHGHEESWYTLISSKTNGGQIYIRSRKHLRQTAEKPLETVTTVPEGAEDETTIPTKAPQ